MPGGRDVFPPEVLSPEALMGRAADELGETAEKREAGLAYLREQMASHTDSGTLFRFPDADRDLFLLAFLRAKKYRLADAFKMLENFARTRQQNPDWFLGTPESCRGVIESGMTGVFPERAPDGRVIIGIFPARLDRTRFSFLEQMQASVLVTLSLLQSEETQVCGMVCVEDLAGFSLSSMPPHAEAKRQMSWQRDCLPLRMKGIHVVNAPWYVSALVAIVRPFMKRKLLERFRVHAGDLSTLHDLIPKRVLSTEFGGERPYDPSAWLRFHQDRCSQ